MWEYYLDRGYFDLWAVRKAGDKDFQSPDLFHVTSEKEAKYLCEILNKREPSQDDYHDSFI